MSKTEWIAALKDVTVYSALLRLSLAAICGGTIGMERGRHRRAAGFRTHVLVCVGAALVMLTNQYIVAEFGGTDPARLGAQVISGIGFLGVGTIIVDRQHQVRGLTTAAGLWASACMGLALGIGFYYGALIGYIFILAAIMVLGKFEQRVIGKSRIMEIYAEFQSQMEMTRFINAVLRTQIKVERLARVQPRSENAEEGRTAALITLQLPRRYPHNSVLRELDGAPELLLIEEMR